MKSHYCIDKGDVRVIRPLCYVREASTRDFSQSSSFPIINENCPACFEEPKVVTRLLYIFACLTSTFNTGKSSHKKTIGTGRGDGSSSVSQHQKGTDTIDA